MREKGTSEIEQDLKGIMCDRRKIQNNRYKTGIEELKEEKWWGEKEKRERRKEENKTKVVQIYILFI